MSEKKEYTTEEVARMIADKAAEVMKKHEISSEYIEEIMAKSKNSAHEIDPGQDPSSEGTEMQASMEAGSMESSESSEMEDKPLQGESKKEDDDEEDEKEQEDKDEYEFKKSESGMHTIEYKKLVKKEDRCWDGYEPTPGKEPYSKGSCQKKSEEIEKCGDMKKEEEDDDGKVNPSFDREKKDIEWSKDTKTMVDTTRPGGKNKKPSSRKDQAQKIKEAQERRKKMRAEGLIKEEVEKCGDMKVAKSEKLSNFLKKNTSNEQ